MSTSFCIHFSLPYFSRLSVFSFSASIGEPLCALLSHVYLFFVLLLTGLLFLLRAPHSVFAVLLRNWRCLQSRCSQKNGKFQIIEKIARMSMVDLPAVSSVLNLAAQLGVQELLGTVSSSKLSSHQMPIRGFPGVQKVINSLISSELSSHQMAIRGQPGVQRVTASSIPSELSSHQMAIRSHLGVRTTQLSSNHFGVFGADWMHPSRTAFTHYGSGPVRGVPPPGTCPYCASPFFCT